MEGAMRLLHPKSFSLLIALAAIMSSPLASVKPLKAVGESYMAPMYDILSKNYGAYDKSFAVNYRSTKFEDAISSVANNTADFAVVDLPLSRKRLEQTNLLAFPILLTAIVPVVNLPGIQSDQLVLSGPVLADIMAGKIKIWNAPEIKALNPSLALPALPIKRVVRGSASGATLSFTSYLARYSGDFNNTVGAGQTVEWPGEYLSVADSNAAANAVIAMEGAISYVEMDHAIIKFLKFVSLKHKSGQVLLANPGFLRGGVVSARAASSTNDDAELTVIDHGQNWPILLPVYVVVKHTAVDDERSKKLLRFFYWNFHTGDRAIEYWGLVPLPSSFQAKSIRIFRNVKSAKGTLLQPEFEFELAR
jgi:phosphate transport system substrate-binding protein